MGRLVLLFSLGLLLQKAMAEPIYPLNHEYRALPIGTTARIVEDLSKSDKIAPRNTPDRSFAYVWVKMFPLLSVPLGDPYPVTIDKNEVALANSGLLNIFDLETGALLTAGQNLAFDFLRMTVDVDGTLYALTTLWIVPQTEITTTIVWDKGSVRSELRGGFVIKPVAGNWSAINVVSVNDYLRSVVPSEVIASWKTETLRAQAIAARTYGLYEVAKSRAEGDEFDVDPTTWFQSYQA